MKLVSVVLVVALVLSGPLAPVAWAQEKTGGQMEPAAEKGDGAWMLGAAVATGVNIPGRTALCALGGVAGFAVLLLSIGSGYQLAGRAWQEGCAGPWVITPAHLKGEVPKE